MNNKRPFLLALLLLACTIAHAQCAVENTAFQSGERLDYELYFNWKFVWMHAGRASLTTTATQATDGSEAYQSRLVTSTSGLVDKHFVMRDTLQSVVSHDLVPLYYKKAANEGGKYYVDQVWYTYPSGTVHLRQQYLNRRGETSHTTTDRRDCIYDMLSMMLRARSYKASDFALGQKLVFPMADGRSVDDVTLVYRGRKNFKMKSTGVTYRCLIFSFVEYEKKKEKEIITFYISDDDNHMPVRLDLFLKFGTAKAYLKKATGLRNPCTSIVE
ncbi:MAG: DUF3108 domain-containing protein [Bacteroidaceae bacterium]|nr:DUF3108 domain-containing protein [Bacteroidaceae bacterium]